MGLILEKMHTIVVTLDIQRDYFPGGAFPLWRAGSALRAARRILDAARAASIPIIHIKHEGLEPAASFLRAGSRWTEPHPGLGIPPDGSEMIIVKHEPDAFLGTELEEALRAREACWIVWMGMMTWMCVDTTLRAAAARGWQGILVEDACASGWLIKDGLPIFPWTSQRAFLAAIGSRFARLSRASETAAWLAAAR